MTIALKGLIKLLTECLLEVFVTRELHTAGEAYQKRYHGFKRIPHRCMM